MDEVIAINNLKYAWQFILENDNLDYDYNFLLRLHKLVMGMLIYNPGTLRTTPVNIGGTDWKPNFPIESQIKEELDIILNQNAINTSKTEIALDIMLYIMRKQMFLDGNKRVAMLFANKIMIDNGCGIITISKELQKTFYTKLLKFYETNDNIDIKKWLYDNCIDGINIS